MTSRNYLPRWSLTSNPSRPRPSYQVGLYQVRVQATWSPKHPLNVVDLNFFKIAPKPEDWFFKLGRVFSLSGAHRDLAGKVMPHQRQFIFHTLDSDPSGNSLGPKFCSGPIGSLDFGVSLVLVFGLTPTLVGQSWQKKNLNQEMTNKQNNIMQIPHSSQNFLERRYNTPLLPLVF